MNRHFGAAAPQGANGNETLRRAYSEVRREGDYAGLNEEDFCGTWKRRLAREMMLKPLPRWSAPASLARRRARLSAAQCDCE